MKYNSGIFYGPIFIAFGLGLFLSKVLPHTEGLYYMGIGFVVFIMGIIFAKGEKTE